MPDAPPPPDNDRSSSSAQQAVLIALRRIGPASPDALAAELGISRSAAVARLRTLSAVGLVARDVERHGVGRPRHRYDLTAAAQTLLPSNYASLATGLLDALQAVADESLVDRRSSPSVAAGRPTLIRGPLRRPPTRRRTAPRARPRAGRHPGRAGLPVRLHGD